MICLRFIRPPVCPSISSSFKLPQIVLLMVATGQVVIGWRKSIRPRQFEYIVEAHFEATPGSISVRDSNFVSSLGNQGRD